MVASRGGAEALILVGHGGSRHKRDDSTLDFIKELVENNNLAAAAIDGPIHGSRGLEMSSHEASDPSARQEAFLDLWKSPGNGIENMVADWQISLTALLTLPELKGIPIGYFGLSMGTAYGLPFAAADARIGAAVLGMWGRITRIAPCLLSGPDLLNVPCYFCINQRIAFLPWREGLKFIVPSQAKISVL